MAGRFFCEKPPRFFVRIDVEIRFLLHLSTSFQPSSAFHISPVSTSLASRPLSPLLFAPIAQLIFNICCISNYNVIFYIRNFNFSAMLKNSVIFI